MVDISDRRRELLYSVVSISGFGLMKFIWDQRNQEELLRVTQQAGPDQSGANSTFRIAEDEFTIWELGFDRPNRLQYSFEVIDGPPIDVILTDESGQPKADDEDWHYYPTASYLNGKDGMVVDVLPPDTDYRLIFDNSNRLEASPPTNLREDPAIVTFQLDMSPIERTTTDAANETTTVSPSNKTTTAPSTSSDGTQDSSNE